MKRLIALALLVLVTANAALGETQPCCQSLAEGAPLVPIPDPSTWVASTQEVSSSYTQPAGLQPGQTYHVMFATSFQSGLSSDPIVPPMFPRFGGLAQVDQLRPQNPLFSRAGGGFFPLHLGFNF